MDSILRANIKQANKTIIENIAGFAVGVKLFDLVLKKANEEIKAKKDPFGNAAIIASCTKTMALQTRILGDLKRLKKKVKASGDVLDAINNL